MAFYHEPGTLRDNNGIAPPLSFDDFVRQLNLLLRMLIRIARVANQLFDVNHLRV